MKEEKLPNKSFEQHHETERPLVDIQKEQQQQTAPAQVVWGPSFASSLTFRTRLALQLQRQIVQRSHDTVVSKYKLDPLPRRTINNSNQQNCGALSDFSSTKTTEFPETSTKKVKALDVYLPRIGSSNSLSGEKGAGTSHRVTFTDSDATSIDPTSRPVPKKVNDSVEKLTNLNTWIQHWQRETKGFSFILPRKPVPPLKGLAMTQATTSAGRRDGLSYPPPLQTRGSGGFLPNIYLPPETRSNISSAGNKSPDFKIEGANFLMKQNEQLEKARLDRLKTMAPPKFRLKRIKPPPPPKAPVVMSAETLDKGVQFNPGDNTPAEEPDDVVSQFFITSLPFKESASQSLDSTSSPTTAVSSKPPSGRRRLSSVGKPTSSSIISGISDDVGQSLPATPTKVLTTNRIPLDQDDLTTKISAGVNLPKILVTAPSPLLLSSSKDNTVIQKIEREKPINQEAWSSIKQESDETVISLYVINDEEITDSKPLNRIKKSKNTPPRIAAGFWRDGERKGVISKRKLMRLEREHDLILKMSNADDVKTVETDATNGGYDTCLDHFYHLPTTGLSEFFISFDCYHKPANVEALNQLSSAPIL